jgi:isoprenylcysteine carboxyl methyltransferase (ICMT) family protein YpbQ
MTSAVLLLGAITAERLGELLWARSNTAAPLTKGAREFASGHYPAIVLLHGTAYLISEVIAIPLTGFLTRALSMRWLFVYTLVLKEL